jgi:S-adenosylmethionine:tRNA ribosyltransferase-isomerase
MKMLTVDNFNYELPAELIAQHPLPERTASRLLAIDRDNDQLTHRSFEDIIEFITPDDLLIINDTKVIPARLFGIKESGGKIECLIERVVSDHEALAHIRSSKSPKPGGRILLQGELWATVIKREGELFYLKFDGDTLLFDLLEQYGHMPLPPYITREDELNDRERYQTIFAKKRGAVAAPTASLHFSDELFNKIKEQGTQIAKVTLHVGAGTFQPVRVDSIEEHHMHSEWIDVPEETIVAINACKQRGGRVIAIGTTAMRALESCARSGEPEVYKGETDIFIYPGFNFHCVDVLVTNFHLPKSTLLMLVSAFAGVDLTRRAYAAAIEEHYRFFSYGDAMIIF